MKKLVYILFLLLTGCSDSELQNLNNNAFCNDKKAYLFIYSGFGVAGKLIRTENFDGECNKWARLKIKFVRK